MSDPTQAPKIDGDLRMTAQQFVDSGGAARPIPKDTIDSVSHVGLTIKDVFALEAMKILLASGSYAGLNPEKTMDLAYQYGRQAVIQRLK